MELKVTVILALLVVAAVADPQTGAGGKKKQAGNTQTRYGGRPSSTGFGHSSGSFGQSSLCGSGFVRSGTRCVPAQSGFVNHHGGVGTGVVGGGFPTAGHQSFGSGHQVGGFVPGQPGFVQGNRPFVQGNRPFVQGQRPFVQGQRPFVPGQQPFIPGQQPFIPGHTQPGGFPQQPHVTGIHGGGIHGGGVHGGGNHPGPIVVAGQTTGPTHPGVLQYKCAATASQALDGKSETCKLWCDLPVVPWGTGKFACCDDRRGKCPFPRTVCPKLQGHGPVCCFTDSQCPSLNDKCCWDTCLNHKVCKRAEY